jgi:hypothetical protein
MIAVDWNEIGALASIAAVALGVIGGVAKWLITEIRQNRVLAETIKSKVTTPDSVPGTIGETVAQLAVDTDEHMRLDDARISAIWRELGKSEPA